MQHGEGHIIEKNQRGDSGHLRKDGQVLLAPLGHIESNAVEHHHQQHAQEQHGDTAAGGGYLFDGLALPQEDIRPAQTVLNVKGDLQALPLPSPLQRDDMEPLYLPGRSVSVKQFISAVGRKRGGARYQQRELLLGLSAPEGKNGGLFPPADWGEIHRVDAA